MCQLKMLLNNIALLSVFCISNIENIALKNWFARAIVTIRFHSDFFLGSFEKNIRNTNLAIRFFGERTWNLEKPQIDMGVVFITPASKWPRFNSVENTSLPQQQSHSVDLSRKVSVTSLANYPLNHWTVNKIIMQLKKVWIDLDLGTREKYRLDYHNNSLALFSDTGIASNSCPSVLINLPFANHVLTGYF